MDKLMNKVNVLGAVVQGGTLGYKRRPDLFVGDEKQGYIKGDLMDANAVSQLVSDAIGQSAGNGDTIEATIEGTKIEFKDDNGDNRSFLKLYNLDEGDSFDDNSGCKVVLSPEFIEFCDNNQSNVYISGEESTIDVSNNNNRMSQHGTLTAGTFSIVNRNKTNPNVHKQIDAEVINENPQITFTQGMSKTELWFGGDNNDEFIIKITSGDNYAKWTFNIDGTISREKDGTQLDPIS